MKLENKLTYKFERIRKKTRKIALFNPVDTYATTDVGDSKLTSLPKALAKSRHWTTGTICPISTLATGKA